MAHGTIVGIYRLLNLIAEEAHLAPQIILHAPLYEILYRFLPLLAIRQIKHHRPAETIRQTTLGKLGIRLVVSQLSHLHNLTARLMRGRMGQREMRAKWAYMMALTGHNR